MDFHCRIGYDVGVIRGFKFRLYPTPEQAVTLAQQISVCRFVYNLALEQRRDFWRQAKASGRSISFPSQCRELTDLRREFDWIRAVPRTPVDQALRDLDRAYSDFFSGRRGYPGFRAKGRNESLRHVGDEVSIRTENAKWCSVRLMGAGWVKFRRSRDMLGDRRNVTISISAGQWFVSFACREEVAPATTTLPAVGIDRGIANTLSLSNGEHFHLPDSLVQIDRRRRRAQRILARRQRGSNRRRKQLARVSRLSAQIARIRRDWQHRASTDIAQRFGHVALEDLNILAMTTSGKGKRGLNRSILNQGWGAFATMLAYKLEERGGSLHMVNPAYTSQTCAECGVIDKQSRESQSRFVCRHCGHIAHADTNAATNILRRSTSALRVEGIGYEPVEARTIQTHDAALAA